MKTCRVGHPRQGAHLHWRAVPVSHAAQPYMFIYASTYGTYSARAMPCRIAVCATARATS